MSFGDRGWIKIKNIYLIGASLMKIDGSNKLKSRKIKRRVQNEIEL